MEQVTPVELQGERDASIADALKSGTKTADALPLARKAPGDATTVTYVSGES